MNEIKPIETFYNGYRFRSRLEARWAVFFDAMGIEYQYESEGYEHFGYTYLPDFWLPKYKLHAEVKGVSCRGQIPKDDAEKMSWMIDFAGPCSNGIILLGDIPYQKGASDLCWALWKWNGKGLSYGWLAFTEYPDPEGYFDCCDSQSAPHHFNENDDIVLTCSSVSFNLDGTLGNPNSKIEKALFKARTARFEHGEKPII